MTASRLASRTVHRARRAACIGLVGMAGCAGPLRAADPTLPTKAPLFPRGAFDPSAAAGPRACDGDLDRFSEERAAVRAESPPVPGDDAAETLLLLEDQLVLSELLAIQIVHAVYGPSHFSGYETVFVATPPEDDAHVISLPLGGDAQLQARVLLRARVQGGLFDHVSHCEVRSFDFGAPSDGHVRRLVLVDRHNPRGATPTLYLDPPGSAPLPSSRVDD